jgi:hypothetical protein
MNNFGNLLSGYLSSLTFTNLLLFLILAALGDILMTLRTLKRQEKAT